MLDDRERRLCREIEEHLAAEDPAFVRRMRTADRPRLSPAAAMLCALFFIATPILALTAGWPAALTAFLIFLIALPVVLHRVRR